LEITSEIPAGRQVIQSYGESGFRISGVVIRGSVIVLPQRSLAWQVARPEDVTIETLSPVIDAEPKVELLLLGCGRRQIMLAGGLLEALKRVRLIVEPMDTGAACRTYNVLLAEDRRVAAALIAPV
jgi:uncharacterized protein